MYCYRRVEGCLYGGKLFGSILGFWVPRECRIIPIACRSPNVVLSQWPVGDSFLVISVGQWGCSVAVSSLMAPDGSSDPWNIFSVFCAQKKHKQSSRRIRNNLGAAVRNFRHDYNTKGRPKTATFVCTACVSGTINFYEVLVLKYGFGTWHDIRVC